MSSELTTLTNRLLSEVGPREPLPLDEELQHARLVADGKRAAKRLAEPGLPRRSGASWRRPRPRVEWP
jgi:hypothetical protein